ncbi:hypothetical protein [Bizionia arctica]|uniref:Uncharacterized protein n=1 Tax=Bizionia arctica TaxID=1495645 RepID=A0A917GK55_9FLAO|nr:hypothetical protein [Bizionia arctica]GGG48960.1 hypothetical protein GCM10010976_20370 [Bizionia arctica]
MVQTFCYDYFKITKIRDVGILNVLDGRDVAGNDIPVITKIQFHDLDIQNNMEYCLHLFVYNVYGIVNPPLIITN